MTVVWNGSVTGTNRGLLCTPAHPLVGGVPATAEPDRERRRDARARVLMALGAATSPLSLHGILVAVNRRRRQKLTVKHVHNALYRLVRAGVVQVTAVHLMRSRTRGPRFVRGYALVLEGD